MLSSACTCCAGWSKLILFSSFFPSGKRVHKATKAIKVSGGKREKRPFLRGRLDDTLLCKE